MTSNYLSPEESENEYAQKQPKPPKIVEEEETEEIAEETKQIVAKLALDESTAPEEDETIHPVQKAIDSALLLPPPKAPKPETAEKQPTPVPSIKIEQLDEDAAAQQSLGFMSRRETAEYLKRVDELQKEYYASVKSEIPEDTLKLFLGIEREYVKEIKSETSSLYVCGCLDKPEEVSISEKSSEILFDSLVHHTLYEEADMGSVASYVCDELGPTISPLVQKWCFGYNSNVPVINLTIEDRKEVFFIASHKGVIMNYESKNIKCLDGHSQHIVDSSADASGRYLVTSSLGSDGAIIFHDAVSLLSINTLFNGDDDNGAVKIAISPNAKYMISVHDPEAPVLKFWQWTYGNEEPDDTYTYEGKRNLKEPVKIIFHPNKQEYFTVAFQRQVMFGKWDKENKKLQIPPALPKVKRKIGYYTSCAMLRNWSDCYASTTAGYIIIFCNNLCMDMLDGKASKNYETMIKIVKVSRYEILALESVNDLLVCLNDKSLIQYFDKQCLLMFWIDTAELRMVQSISFNLIKRNYKFEDPFNVDNDFFFLEDPLAYLEEEPEDRVEEYELLYRNTVPTDCTIEMDPFLARSFAAGCRNGNIYYVNHVTETYQPLMSIVDSNVMSIDCWHDRPYLVIAYENGRVSLYNYENLTLIRTYIIEEEIKKKVKKPISITYIKYSPETLYLCLATTSGQLWFLNAILEPLENMPTHVCNDPLSKLVYSKDVEYIAAYTTNRAVYLLNHSRKGWARIGKIRSHTRRITDILFTHDRRLFTISEDRHIVEYNVDPEDDSLERLTIATRIQIEQTAVPMSFKTLIIHDELYFLITTNEQKYKFLHEKTRTCRYIALGPSHGCYGNSPVNRITFIKDKKFMVFATENYLGIQKLYPDGNPFKYMGVLANPKIKKYTVSPDAEYIFSCGYNDQCVMMWKTATKSVDILHQIGGMHLEPLYCLIEGGEHGWYFKEIQDLFCYMQILEQNDFYQTQRFRDALTIDLVPDLMRACGYYPSEYEIKDILTNARFIEYFKTKKLKDTVTFTEFIRLLVNHRPAHGMTLEELENFYDGIFSRLVPLKTKTMKFIEKLCSAGEMFTNDEIKNCFVTLMNKVKGPHDVSEPPKLPSTMTFDFLVNEILGILEESNYADEQQKLLDEGVIQE